MNNPAYIPPQSQDETGTGYARRPRGSWEPHWRSPFWYIPLLSRSRNLRCVSWLLLLVSDFAMDVRLRSRINIKLSARRRKAILKEGHEPSAKRRGKMSHMIYVENDMG